MRETAGVEASIQALTNVRPLHQETALMTTWVFRFLGIVLASVELLMLAMRAFGLQFSVPAFEEFMWWLSREFANFFAPVEVMVRQIVSSFGFHLPQFGEHWHHVFVLIWLLFGSAVRTLVLDNVPTKSTTFVADVFVQITRSGWAGVCALFIAVGWGNESLLGRPEGALVVGFLLFWIGFLAVSTLAGRSPNSLLAGLAMMLLLNIFATAALLPIVAEVPLTDSSARSLFWLMGYIGFVSILVSLIGLFEGRNWRERLVHPATAFGMDIIGAYAIAFALAYIFGGHMNPVSHAI